jgi:cell division protein FtsB
MAGKFSTPAVRAGILALVAIAIALSLAVPLRSFVRQADENAALAADVAAKEANVDDLAGQIVQWQDKDFVEDQARSRLSYVYPGETTYVVVDEQGAVTNPLPPPNATDLGARSWYERFWASVDEAR